MYITREKVIKTSLLVAILVIATLAIGVVISGINHFKLGSQLAGINQVSNLSHLLVRQQAKLFSLMLARNAKNEELIEALDEFSKEEFVIDANLYLPNGTLIVQSRNARPLKEFLSSGNGKSQTQQIVEPIFAQQALVGFLRVTFDAEYAQTTKDKVEILFHRLYGELIILVIVGVLIANSIGYYFRKRQTYIHLPPKPVLNSTKSQTQRFHSRRRVFQRK